MVSTTEAILRMPEVDDIRDDDLYEAVTDVITDAPDYFWTAAAASSHHPEQHQSRHGLWLHTKRVCTVFERLAPSMVKQDHMEWYDVDCGRAACLLHDIVKYGREPTDVESTTRNHDREGAQLLYNAEAEIPDAVIGAVESHNGPWYSGDSPSTHLEQVVHISDMVASDPNCNIAVKEPHQILQDRFPTVGERDD